MFAHAVLCILDQRILATFALVTMHNPMYILYVSHASMRIRQPIKAETWKLNLIGQSFYPVFIYCILEILLEV